MRCLLLAGLLLPALPAFAMTDAEMRPLVQSILDELDARAGVLPPVDPPPPPPPDPDPLPPPPPPPPPPPLDPTCPELTSQGSIIARVTAPTGSGSKNLEVIRDGIQGISSSTQYDTFDGSNAAPDDWIGYTYPAQQTFGKVVFQEGGHFSNGGWFETLTVQVRQAGVWVPVSGLVIIPTYPGVRGVGFQTYTMSFGTIQGDGIRLFGNPGGSADFISVGELRIYEQ